MKKITKTLAAVTAAAGIFACTPAAHATPSSLVDPQRIENTAPAPTPSNKANYVAFGDSFAANPGESDSVPTMGSCVNSAKNYGAVVGQMTGMEVRNFSCNGALAYLPSPAKNIRAQIDDAVFKKALDKNTKLVTISIGANDTIQGSMLPPQVQDDSFVNSMTENIRIIRENAPNAQIQLVGYPEFASATDAMMCPANFGGVAPRIPMPLVRDLEQNLQRRQITTAEKTGTTFVNMKEVSNVNVAMCGKDGERHMSAIVDTDTQTYNMLSHPTVVGSQILAEQIVAHYK